MQTANRFNENEARQFIKEQHDRAYAKLCDVYTRLGCAPVEPPTFTIVDCVYRHCGMYKPATHDLQYSLPYCVLADAEYWTTVAHEMVHAFQTWLKYGDCNVAHGKTFLFLLGEMGIDVSKPSQQIYHAYSLRGAEAIAEELKTARGGWSHHVSMQPTRRKSLRESCRQKGMQDNDI